MTLILDGKSLRDTMRHELRNNIEALVAAHPDTFPPTLVIIQVGDSSASNVYIRMKKAFGESIGATVIHKKFDESVSEETLKEEILLINHDKTIHGVIVQLPLPSHLRPFDVIETIDPLKDCDGLHSKSRAKGFLPATTRGIMTLLSHYNIEIEGKNVLIVGRSYLVGTPTALAFLNKNATITVAHSKTQNLPELCKKADIVISAVGYPGLITKEMVSEGQVIIDVGINNHDGKIVGDVDFDEVKPIVGAITPVPGGIGPLTVASLFANLVDLYKASL